MPTANAAGFVLIVVAAIMLLGCRSEERNEFGRRSKDTSKFIEYLEVEGECFEDHVKQPAFYTGSIVHWYNVTKDEHSRYGFVHHTSDMLTMQKAYKYYPPSSIGFSDLRQEDIEGDELQLPGISELYSEAANRASYESTCVLKVTRRLDYLRSLQEKTAQ